MKISSNYNNKINFGYDKQLNKELKKQLAACPDKKWSKTFSEMNSICNSLETVLTKEEKNQYNPKSRYNDYLELFLYFKEMFVGYVEIYFNKLSYADREYAGYQKEYQKLGSKPDDWRQEICEYIKGWTSFDFLESIHKKAEDMDLKDIPKLDENDSDKDNANKSDENKTFDFSSIFKESFLEKFQKNNNSPSGFSDVAGMGDLKRDLNENIIEFIQNPQQAQLDFEEYGKTIPKAILLYGPPGCGKTYITQALASEIDSPMFLLNISKSGSRYINQTAKNLKDAFDEAIGIAKKADKPCLLFMDEIDSLGFNRDMNDNPEEIKQIATILQSIDNAKDSNVIIIGATNKYNLLDPAVRRRFDAKIFVDIPDKDSVKDLVKKNLVNLKKGQKLLSSPDDIEIIAQKLQGYSNNSICNISKNASLNAMRRGRADISVEDYIKAIETTTEEKPDRTKYLPDKNAKKKEIGFKQ